MMDESDWNHQIIDPYVHSAVYFGMDQNKYWMAPKSIRFIKIPFSFCITSNETHIMHMQVALLGNTASGDVMLDT